MCLRMCVCVSVSVSMSMSEAAYFVRVCVYAFVYMCVCVCVMNCWHLFLDMSYYYYHLDSINPALSSKCLVLYDLEMQTLKLECSLLYM